MSQDRGNHTLFPFLIPMTQKIKNIHSEHKDSSQKLENFVVFRFYRPMQ